MRPARRLRLKGGAGLGLLALAVRLARRLDHGRVTSSRWNVSPWDESARRTPHCAVDHRGRELRYAVSGGWLPISRIQRLDHDLSCDADHYTAYALAECTPALAVETNLDI